VTAVSDIGRRIDAVVRAGLAPELKAAGFRKAARTFRRPFPLGMQVVNVQASRWNGGDTGQFTINLGVHLPAVDVIDGRPPRGNPTEWQCQVRRRIGFLFPDPDDHWWEIGPATDLGVVSDEVRQAWLAHVPEWFRRLEAPAELVLTAARASGWVGCRVALGLGDRARAAELLAEVATDASGGFAQTVAAFGRAHSLTSATAVRRRGDL
jgi:hypothetical protein